MTPIDMIDFDSNIPYYIQLIDVLKGKINNDEWGPGDQLPSEPDMCNIYSVSRTVVRQALRELELEGLIIRRKGKGTFVAEPKISESLAQKLTGFYQDMTERGYTPVTKVLRQEVAPASKKIAGLLEVMPGTKIIEMERLRYIEGEPILLVTTYIPYTLCPEVATTDFSHQSLYAFIKQRYGLEVDHGRRTLEAVAANEREAKLLDVELRTPLMLLDSVSYLEDGTPIEYYHAVHRGDRSRFEVELVSVPEQASIQEVLGEEITELPPSN